MKKIFFALAVAAVAALPGCNENEMSESEVPAGLFFAFAGDSAENQSAEFSASFSFLSGESWCTVVPIEVRAVGPMVNLDRRISMHQVWFESIDDETAVPVALPADKDIKQTKAWLYIQAQINGDDLSTPEAIDAATKDGITAHYVDFNHPKLMEWVTEFGDSNRTNLNTSLPAGATNTWFPVLILKDPSLSTTTSTTPVVGEGSPLKIFVQLQPNEFFSEMIINRDYSAAYHEISITMTNMMTIPSNWSGAWSGTFRSYGPRKFEIMRTVTGFSDWNLINGIVSQAQKNYWVAQCRMWLETYKAQHGVYPKEPKKEGQSYSEKDVTFNSNY